MVRRLGGPTTPNDKHRESVRKEGLEPTLMWGRVRVPPSKLSYRRRDSNPSEENAPDAGNQASPEIVKIEAESERSRDSEPLAESSRPFVTPQPKPSESKLEAAIVRATLA